MQKVKNFQDWYFETYREGEYFLRLKALQLDEEPYCQMCGKHKAVDVIHVYTHTHEGKPVFGFEHLKGNTGAIKSACKNCVIRYGYYPVEYKPTPWERFVEWFMND